MGPKKHRFAVLDAWRGIAACLVALLHATSWHGFNTHLDHVTFIQNSWLMVDFFFVLSGFVISHAALGKITNGKAAKAFIIRRFGRLWPLHVLVLALFVGLAVAKSIASHGAVPAFAPYHSRLSVFYNLLMIQTIDVSAIYAWNSASWTIGVEFYTYFVFVGVCLLVTRRRFSTIAPSLVLIGLALIALIAGGTAETTSMARCIYGFFAGHLTYLFWRRQKNHSAIAEWLALALAVAIVSFGAITSLPFFAPPVFAFAVWVFAAETGLPSRFAKTAPMQNLGAWSYSIYMTHMLGIHALISLRAWLDARHLAWDGPWTGDAIVTLYLAAIILLSGVTYRYIENPARNYFNRLAGSSEVHVSRSSAVV